MSTRKRKNHKIFVAHTKGVRGSGVCEFCKFDPSHKQVIKQYPEFHLVVNIFPYDVWDSCGVIDHLLVTPVRHVDSISNFNPAEQKQYLKIIAEYENKGYSVYARAASNGMKSVVHQHTHLIKLDNMKKKIIIATDKPRFLLTR